MKRVTTRSKSGVRVGLLSPHVGCLQHTTAPQLTSSIARCFTCSRAAGGAAGRRTSVCSSAELPAALGQPRGCGQGAGSGSSRETGCAFLLLPQKQPVPHECFPLSPHVKAAHAAPAAFHPLNFAYVFHSALLFLSLLQTNTFVCVSV